MYFPTKTRITYRKHGLEGGRTETKTCDDRISPPDVAMKLPMSAPS